MPSYKKNKRKGYTADEEQKSEISVSQKYEQQKKSGTQKKGLKKPGSKLKTKRLGH